MQDTSQLKRNRQHPPQLVWVVLVCLRQPCRQVLHHILIYRRLLQVGKQAAQQRGDAGGQAAAVGHRRSRLPVGCW